MTHGMEALCVVLTPGISCLTLGLPALSCFNMKRRLVMYTSPHHTHTPALASALAPQIRDQNQSISSLRWQALCLPGEKRGGKGMAWKRICNLDCIHSPADT